MIEYDNHIDIHLEWQEKDFDALMLEPCRDNSRNPQVYNVVQKDLVSFEKVVRRSKKWLGKITV